MRIRFSVRGVSFLLPNPTPNWRIPVKSFTTQLSLLQDAPLSFRFFSSSSTSPSSPNPKQCSFTVSYLINSCGLSADSALSASQKLHLVTPERPDSVLTLLRNYGITDTQLPKLLRVYPTLLLADPEKTLLPKLEFSILKLLQGPTLGASSLPGCFCIQALTRIFLEDVNNAGKARQVSRNCKGGYGNGIRPLKMVFIKAIHVLAGMSKPTWEHKMEVYRRWGLSNHEIMLLFRAFPICMSLSEKKIMSTMDFLVNKMGWNLTAITKVPSTLSYSLEKRIIPRCSVAKVLILKGW
ncbi:hypothetical protein CK203_066036 [Vitis vinifera]|uniref:Transcription termination factor MTEF1, chloroplastic n=1 Tax=Vitis vinifera TaxID=29760 RepID=A0A438FNH4_VITVI|nr:hypothetical protein CK203_066036 [Vitis vinifera]